LLIKAHGHCLVVERDGWVIGVVTLIDLQRAISAGHGGGAVPLEDCRRSDLLWLPKQANLAQLEDQLVPNGLRQVPVFDLIDPGPAQLPAGLPNNGLQAHALMGLASRDGMARALARQLHS
jgi:hypothetical protein